MFQQIVSVLENISPNPPPLPDAFGVGTTFDWANQRSVSGGRWAGTEGSMAPAQRHAPVGDSVGLALQDGSRTLRALFTSGRERLSSLKSRRVHPYAQVFKRNESKSPQHPDILHDWATDASPTPSISHARMPLTTPSTPNYCFATPISSPNSSPSIVEPSTVPDYVAPVSHHHIPLPPKSYVLDTNSPNHASLDNVRTRLFTPSPPSSMGSSRASSLTPSLSTSDRQGYVAPGYSTNFESLLSSRPVASVHPLPTQQRQPSATLEPAASSHASCLTADVEPNVVSGQGATSTFDWLGKPNGLLHALEDKASVPRPLFRSGIPPAAEIFVPPPPELEAASYHTNDATDTTSSAPLSSYQARTPGTNVVYFEPDVHSQASEPYHENIDDELLEAYGMEVSDTGFQGTLSSPESRTSKAKSSKTSRSKKSLPVPKDSKWIGGPGGPMKFGSKPDGYVEAVGRLARWSYSENGTNSQNANERQVGDIHFSPALEYDDEQFMSWVCMIEHAGAHRWVRFKAGQPHPLHDGYVLRPAQLPRLVPRWLKETSYKATQLVPH